MEPRVLLLPECVVESEWEVLSLPSSRQVVLTSAGKLLELVVLERRLGSWLLDETLVASGRLFVATDLDPLFVLLPLLPSGQFRPLGDVLSEGGPAFAKLAAKDKSLFQRVAAICDVKEIPGVDGQFVRLSRSKTFRWLLCKVDDAFEAVGSGLAGRVAFVGGAAVARSLVVEEVAEDVASKALSEEGKRAIAVELIRDYVGDEWGKVLYKHFGLPERVVERTNKQTTLAFAPVDVHPLGTNVAKAEEPKKSAPEVTAGQKRLRKVDTSGMTKLTQMFAKKPKKTE